MVVTDQWYESLRPLWLNSWLCSRGGADAAGGRVKNGVLAFALRRARCLYHHMGHTRGPSIRHAKIQALEFATFIKFLLTKKQV